MNYSEVNELEILEFLLEEEGIELNFNQSSISRYGRTQVPASFQQRRLWFLYELEPTSSAYNISSIFRLQGSLEVQVLKQAFQQLQQRHESLRTTFVVIDGEPWQYIHAEVLTELEIEDWSKLPETEIEKQIPKIAASEAGYSFDLKEGALFRARLFQLEPEEHLLSLTLHHIIADAWSLGVLLEELALIYELLLKKDQVSLPELRIQYSDYSIWQQEKIAESVWEEHLVYWKKQLAQLPILEFPTDFPRPSLQSFRGDLVQFTIPSELTNAIRRFSQKENVSLFTTLMAAFQTLLARYSGQEDVSVGTSIANRQGIDTERLIGFFVNTLVIRTDLSGEPSFRTLVSRVNKTVLGAFEHSEVSFETLVEYLQIERDTSRNPLFQIAFTLLNAPKPKFERDNLEITSIASQNAARFDLELFITEEDENLSAVLSYNTDLFTRETAVRITRHFCELVKNLLAQPDAPVYRLPILLPEEQVPSAPREHFVVDYCLNQAFNQQVYLHPDHQAVSFENQSLTYKRLNEKANQWARYLIDHGAKPEVRVGLLVNRSLEMVIAILAILKAGAAYVPIDPQSPQERIAYILEDSGVSFLLTQVEFASQVVSHQTPSIFLENCQEEISRKQSTDPSIVLNPDNAAYVIYTSGSTGKPKGVIVTHHNVVRLMLATQKWYNFNEKDIWTLFHSCAFDFSVWEIWGALFFGGHLIVVPYSVTRSPEEFYHLLCDKGVTVLNQTPSAFRQLIEAEEVLCRESEVNLRFVIFGGEALDLSSLKPWFDRHSDDFPLLVNMYGITETTVHVTYRPIRWRDVKKATGSIIGEPIPDLCVYLLDRYGQPVPTGVTGEIYVGGEGVSRGYLNRPDLTAERMVPNPAGSEGRLYKTGDLGKYLANGELEYLGRNDHQVKIRGFRIELGEIETLLQTHPGVRHSCVIPWAQNQDDVRLIAYIVPQTDPAKTPGYENLITEQIQEWQYTFNETYRSSETELDAAFNIVGWNSSYDGKPIPAEEMRQWLDNTLAQIRSLKPSKVLEIGCGTGMILLNIAAEVDTYWATDFSSEAIARLRKILHQRQWDQVHLQQQEANNFSGLPQSYFDTIVINSVAQYFPSLEYLQQVIAGALDLLAPGGSIFIGDNRHLLLLDCFYSSVAFAQLVDDTKREDFQQKVQVIAENENELTLDPIFFADLPQTFPAIAGVEIYLKREKTNNEMTKYRYDVVLHKQGDNKDPINPIWFDWQSENCQLSDVRDRLSQEQSFAIGWCGVPNGQLLRDKKIWHWYRDVEDCATVGELRNLLDRNNDMGVVPGDFYDLAVETGCEVIITYSANGDPSYFDVLFYTKIDGVKKRRCPFIMPLVARNSSDRSSYYLNPLKGRFAKALINGLKDRASKQLPEYMRPGAYMLLDRLPITSNGKLDRRSLPLPNLSRAISQKSFVDPQTSTQNILCLVWRSVLGLDHLGITDNFFELGGHSLLATKLVSRIREQFNIVLPLRAIFEHPTVIELAEEVDKLLLQRDQHKDLAKYEISQVKNRDNLPLSFAQQRLWFLNQLEPDNPAYNIVVGFRLHGILDEEALSASLQEIVTRHEVLRTNFDQDDQGNPVQVIHPSAEITLNLTDLSDLLESEREEKLMQAVNQTLVTPFNLKTDPLLRVYLYRLGEQTYVLVAVMHHIVSDAWSFGIVVKELTLLYDAFCRGDKSPLLPLTLQYGDFAFWQRTVFEREELPKQLAYWQEELSTEVEPLNLPTDFPRPAIVTYEGRSVSFTINRDHYLRFKQLCESQGVTLFMGLLTVWKVLLMRYSGQHDILVGTPIANRNRREVEDLIGFFVNTLVIRTDLSGNPSFVTLLKKVKEKTLQAYAHQDLPFEKLVETLQPERNLSHSPIFQVMFVLQNAPSSNLELADLEFIPLELEQVTAKFDFSLQITETETGLQGLWEYKTDLFEEATINRMIGHFQNLLSAVIETPELGICQLPLISTFERHQLLVEWNDTLVDYPQSHCIHQLFEAQVESTPDAVAVIFENEQLTYRELNTRANHLAHYLQTLGVKPEVLVGIFVERSIHMVVGLLGILKAGGAYVPLDPEYPQERLAFILEDATVSVLLTQQHLVAKLPEHKAHLVYLDSEAQEFAQTSELPNPCGVEPSNLAYVIYTSGSTGKPKGAMNTHQGVCNRLLWMQDTYKLSSGDRVLQKTPFSFDVSVWEFFLPLLAGACLVVAKPEGHKDIAYLVEIITQQQITTIHFVPSMLQVFLEDESVKRCHSLKQVICSGEALPRKLQEHFFSCLECKLHNLYGPTEAAIDVTYWQCERESRLRMVPIGRPISNTQIYILDQYLQPIPIGIPGELHIGGVGLARGYLNRSELTQEKFIPNPFKESGEQPLLGSQKLTYASSERLYKTGDLARYLPDGNIEFLGRLDDQIKIRGFRIELREIEFALNSYDDVEQSIVIAHEDNPSDKYLVAYVVTEHEININALKNHLKQQLPNYMVPSLFVQLKTLPLNTNGKVNRKALPAPTLNKLVHSENCILPRTKLEHQLAKIWEVVLKIKPISVTDNFFELGGYSLLAIILVNEIEKELGYTLPVLKLFEERTIEKIALYLENYRDSSDHDILIPLQIKGNKTPLFLVHPAGGYGLIYSFLANKLDQNQPVYALQSQGLDGKQQPLSSIKSMASAYIKVMREIQPFGSYLIGGYSLGGLIAFEIASQLESVGESVQNLLIIDTHPPDREIIVEDEILSLIIFVTEVGLHFNVKIELDYEEIAVLNEAERLEHVLQIFQHHQLVPPNSGRNLVSGAINVHKANSQASLGYQPKPINTPISLFKTEGLAQKFPNNPTLGWEELTSKQVYVRTVKGIHEELLREPSVTELGAAIQEIL
ncbi:amino acid adenylation domain-containing protein [Aetokthonos hydrillicola Thurmond2011]|jgi:amino acid adenylation domain-containing protein|uniref:Amino acid adenylation domain-containing protein n=1 Tax=Aetokthonos hydrillicola Thurmond2011 TaxID=2712845 RepID=A0AAP5I8Z1_9CYAN|nr:non-ribosomal peptide synthetase [Aetokthonos hydrillicola]MDR9897010.1 amino acid adenylation domain-containing protein [Aetokthonos hydrillicola Thurmond2011]